MSDSPTVAELARQRARPNCDTKANTAFSGNILPATLVNCVAYFKKKLTHLTFETFDSLVEIDNKEVYD
jgi:hypothetical protein